MFWYLELWSTFRREKREYTEAHVRRDQREWRPPRHRQGVISCARFSRHHRKQRVPLEGLQIGAIIAANLIAETNSL